MTDLWIRTGITGNGFDGWRVYVDVTDPDTGDVHRQFGGRVHSTERSANDAVTIFEFEMRALFEAAGHTITEHPE